MFYQPLPPKHLDLLKYKCFKDTKQMSKKTQTQLGINKLGIQLQKQTISVNQKIVETSYYSSKTQNPEFNTQEEPKNYRLTKDSEAIIFFKQSYEQLFHDPTLEIPKILGVTIRFFNDLKQGNQVIFKITQISSQNDPQDISTQLSITLMNDGSQSKEPVTKIIKDRVMPGNSPNPTLQAKKLLQKKCWIRISASMNSASIHFNDFSTLGKEGTLETDLSMKNRSQWSNSQNIFHLSDSGNYTNIMAKSPLQQLNSFQFSINYDYGAKSKLNTKQQRISLTKFLKVDILQLTVPQGPVLVKNASLLKNDANLFYLDKEIRILYQFLQNLSITHLPQLEDFKQPHPRQKQYYQWRNTNAAVNNSITTEPGYLTYQVQNKQTNTWELQKQPVGILNVLMQVKSYNPQTKKCFKWDKFRWSSNKTFEQNLEEICTKRVSYVRMQLCPQQGIAPGSKAVLQIWPPFCCSSIHNHGEAYGLIKVLSNEILVQNFNDLSFMPADNLPYQQNIYQKESYTWLSQHSYAIHRLINPTNQTTLSLQAYMSNKYSEQFFQFINKDQGKYAEYYPQNDWVNFLKWPKLNENKTQDPNIAKFVEYINTVQNFYKVSGDSSYFFFDFIMTLKSEYEIFNTFLKSNIKVRNIKFIPF